MKLPRTTWVPGEGERPDDAWLLDVDPELLVEVGAMLFERGQGFEAHEAWELAWRQAKAARRDGRDEKILRALIKLAAAMVKLRQGNETGVREHVRGARTILHDLEAGSVDEACGIRVVPLVDLTRQVERALDEASLVARPVGQPTFGKIARRIGRPQPSERH